MSGPARNWIDYATFVDLERDSVAKHEWFDGQIYAMAGGTFEHGALAANVIAKLAALGASLEVDRVFEGVELSEATRPAVG